MESGPNNSQFSGEAQAPQRDEPRKVLIVEDEALIAMYVEDVISNFGYSVVGVASNLEDALDFLESTAFDMAVLDINLRGQLVFPLADALMKKRIPFIFASSYGENSVPARYRSGPVVQKPFAASELRRALIASERLTQRTSAR